MRSSFLPKHEQKIVRIPEILTIFRSYLGELMTSLIHSEIYKQQESLRVPILKNS